MSVVRHDWSARPLTGAAPGEQKTGQRVPVTGLWKCRCGSVSRYSRYATFHGCRDCGVSFRSLLRRL